VSEPKGPPPPSKGPPPPPKAEKDPSPSPSPSPSPNPSPVVSDNAAPPETEHTRAQAMFSDLLDDALSASDKSTLDSHLASCIACSAELATFKQTMAALRGKKSDTPSPEFMSSLRDQIRERSRGRFFGDRRPSHRLEIASLMTLILVATIYVVLKMIQPLLMLH
jgi:hypothetical protein